MKNMKLSVKLIGSFVIVAAITLVVGFVGWNGVQSLSDHLVEIGQVQLPSIQSLLVIEEKAEAIRVAQRTLLNPHLGKEARQQQYDNIAKARAAYREAWEVYAPLPQTPEEATLWKQFVPAWEAWAKENNAFMDLSRTLDKTDILNPDTLRARMEQFRGDHYKLMAETGELIDGGAQFSGGDDHTACAFGKWLAGYQSENAVIVKALAAVDDPHRRFHDVVKKIKSAVAAGDHDTARNLYATVMKPAAAETFGQLYVIRDEIAKSQKLFADMEHQAMVTAREKQAAALALLEKIVRINDDVAAAAQKASAGEAALAKIESMVGMIAGFVVALGFGIFLSVSISRALTKIIGGLSEGAEQVASAAGQVSSASQSLASGASEQAASLEESSASLEEMSTMTKQNAANAGQADSLMKEANQVVAKANTSMEQMITSMAEISTASEETSKIIKTIDEIAFQTNLLALNAAVEAARAGEAGAGFAVVADEVRNLAMRAADAAKNTAALIEGTVKKVSDGSALVSSTSEGFAEVARSAAKVGEIVGEIAAASSEQAQGIQEINKAVTEMDKITQQNAANAEESASASEEMNAQAEQMKAFVEELVQMVGGNEGGGLARKNAPRHVRHHGHLPSAALKGKNSGTKALPQRATQELSPEKLIPLDDEFSDF
ncbi:MAG: methyl-accepting chemotaxis protein [Pseudomonadota bacterium]